MTRANTEQQKNTPWFAKAGAACSIVPRSFTVEDFAAVEKIDVHVHINSTGSALIDEAEADHFRLLTKIGRAHV